MTEKLSFSERLPKMPYLICSLQATKVLPLFPIICKDKNFDKIAFLVKSEKCPKLSVEYFNWWLNLAIKYLICYCKR